MRLDVYVGLCRCCDAHSPYAVVRRWSSCAVFVSVSRALYHEALPISLPSPPPSLLSFTFRKHTDTDAGTTHTHNTHVHLDPHRRTTEAESHTDRSVPLCFFLRCADPFVPRGHSAGSLRSPLLLRPGRVVGRWTCTRAPLLRRVWFAGEGVEGRWYVEGAEPRGCVAPPAQVSRDSSLT